MKTIVLFGAGQSATVLIEFLESNAAQEDWQIIVVDANLSLAESKITQPQYAKAVSFDILNESERSRYIKQADIVISMLPHALHIEVAKDCVRFQKNLLTASYADKAMQELQPEIEKKRLLFLCEMGLDPGIDHMSAKKIIDEIQFKGGTITSFTSHCGGLVAPESDDNPWHYKVSWNPGNIINAGKTGGHYKENGKEVFVTYNELFQNKNLVTIPGLDRLAWYPNRDSLHYTKIYGLENVPTFIRSTLRHPDFMSGWQQLIQLKFLDENIYYNTDGKSLQTLFTEHLQQQAFDDWTYAALAGRKLNATDQLFFEQFCFLGLTDNETKINAGKCSIIDIMRFAVVNKLKLFPTDKDMIVMLHQFTYECEGKKQELDSVLIAKGENNLRTAMAKTVGLPLGIAAKFILQGRIKMTGLQIPIAKEIYEPVLAALAIEGIVFRETYGAAKT